MDKQIENLYKKLEIINTWIGNVDTKVSYVLTFIGVLFGFFVGVKGTSDISGIIKHIYFNGVNSIAINKCFLLGLLGAFIATSIISMIFLCKALKGNIDITVYEQEGIIGNSNIFFCSISNKSYIDFYNEVKDEDDEMLIKDIASQIYINSKICNSKFSNYNKGLKYTIISVCIFFAYTILNYFVF